MNSDDAMIYSRIYPQKETIDVRIVKYHSDDEYLVLVDNNAFAYTESIEEAIKLKDWMVEFVKERLNSHGRCNE